jgi:hypothetical protein
MTFRVSKTGSLTNPAKPLTLAIAESSVPINARVSESRELGERMIASTAPTLSPCQTNFDPLGASIVRDGDFFTPTRISSIASVTFVSTT